MNEKTQKEHVFNDALTYINYYLPLYDVGYVVVK